MHIIRMLILGLVVGILARFFYPGHVHLNLLYSIGLGIVGSLIAGLVITVVSGNAGKEPFHPAGLIGSTLGAMVVIFVARHFLHIV